MVFKKPHFPVLEQTISGNRTAGHGTLVTWTINWSEDNWSQEHLATWTIGQRDNWSRGQLATGTIGHMNNWS